MVLQSEKDVQKETHDATRKPYSHDICIPQLIATQASAMPKAVALVMNGQVLTYEELNQRANQVAHFLLAHGVGPQMLVGLCVGRSLDMVVGLLGILKAGAAYVPLDATYPTERLHFMLQDAQAQAVITQQHLMERLSTANAPLLSLDAAATTLAQYSTSEPTTVAKASDRAYVIYTSGSTGQPKGVEITHGNVLNLVFWHQRAFAITATDRATQVASPAFDATGWEVWPYLTCGASIYLVDEDTRLDPVLLRDWLLRQQITITFLPTALAENVLLLNWPTQAALRFLLTGADTLHHYPARDLPFTLINNYGPTEATVVATSGEVPSNEHPDMPPSIGRPIDNAQIYILDEFLRHVPIGQAGELYIGGAGLAKGYLNRPELTAERFIRHPFSDEPNARLYKTGDRVRYLADGQIAFMGRIDQQIKIRGYRIEPNEIVTALNAHPAIQASAVIAREDTPGNKCLVAYVVPVADAEIAASVLQEELARHLPEYMIPAVFVQMAALPVTTNGKVALTALPMPDQANTLHHELTTLPETLVEKRVADIVSASLGLEQVGIDENFFMLGGHSLLGTQVITRIADAFDIEISLRTLFHAPTVRQLSAEIEQILFAKLEAMSDEEAALLLEQG